MLNKSQKKRLALVLLFPLTAIGLWLATGGYKDFVPSHYRAVCTRTGDCVGYESNTPPDLAASSGVYLGTVWSGVRLQGGLNDRIVLMETNAERTLFVPDTAKVEGYECSLNYFDKLDHLELVDKEFKTTHSSNDIFTLNCGPYSQPAFRFLDKEIHSSLASAFKKKQELQSQFSDRQSTIAGTAFFVPFVVVFVGWVLMSIFTFVVRFVRFGKKLA